MYCGKENSGVIAVMKKKADGISFYSAGTVIPTGVLSEMGAEKGAKWLLGKLLCRRNADGTVTRGRIVETECYCGEEDTACHAHNGRTQRNEPLYCAGGISYVYLCYGIHALLNIITGADGHPEGILVRGIEGAVGPGRVTKAMGITVADNRLPLTPDSGLWLEDGGYVPKDVDALPRVGIDYAEESDRLRPWRFVAKF
jgi:DNA-3-methyladenine glycosylase